MKNMIFFLFTAILTTAASCNKENPKPEIKNTCGEPRAGCVDCDWNVYRGKVNGEAWCSECDGNPLFGCDPVDCQFYPNLNNTLHIRGGGGNFNSIFFSSNIQLGKNEVSINSDFYYLGTNVDSCKNFAADSLFNNFVEIIDINTEEKIIEGMFELQAANFCQDTVRITDGYFKLTYRQ